MELHYSLASDVHDLSEMPMSRTHQYRKVMKPLLERKRRARINKCLDELKDLMVFALQSDGESITKLEKADVLELTVKHLEKLKKQRMLQANPTIDMDRYHSGFTACANEVSRCLASIPGVDVRLGTHIMTHLGLKLKSLEQQQQPQQSLASPLSVNVPSSSTATLTALPPHSAVAMSTPPSASFHSDGGYSSGRESISPRSDLESPINFVKQEVEERRRRSSSSSEAVWRPF